jgi:hypothetical protein
MFPISSIKQSELTEEMSGRLKLILPPKKRLKDEVFQFMHYVETYVSVVETYLMLPVFHLVDRDNENATPLMPRNSGAFYRVRLPRFGTEVKVPFNILFAAYTGCGLIPAVQNDGAPVLGTQDVEVGRTVIPRGLPIPHFVTTLTLDWQEQFFKMSTAAPLSTGTRNKLYEFLMALASEYHRRTERRSARQDLDVSIYPYAFPVEVTKIPSMDFLSMGFKHIEPEDSVRLFAPNILRK